MSTPSAWIGATRNDWSSTTIGTRLSAIFLLQDFREMQLWGPECSGDTQEPLTYRHTMEDHAEVSTRFRWVVVGVSAIVNSLAWSVRSTFALFYVALLHEFAWGRGEAALGYSLSWLLLIVFSPLA